MPFIIVFFVAFITSLIVSNRSNNKRTGKNGENALEKLVSSVPGYGTTLKNCSVKKSNGSSLEIDLILVHSTGLYVFETKNLRGWIFGNEKQEHWTQVIGKNRFQFYNPYRQNAHIIANLKKGLPDSNVPIIGHVVFSNDCVFKDVTINSDNWGPLHYKDIKRVLKKEIENATSALSNQEVDNLYSVLVDMVK